MSKILFAVLTICLMSISSYAQTGFNYKALIKDDLGNVVSNQEIHIRFTIQTLEGPDFITNYQERHNATTDANGIVIVTIGEGDDDIIGTFPDGFWYPNISLNTEIDIERDGTYVDFGETNFKKVPMAIHADNVFSGDYNDLINQPTIVEPFGLEAIDEGSGIGWRLIGQNPDNYGSVGNGAVDLSQSPNSATNGATGEYSIAMGNQTGASGEHSTAMGYFTIAEARNSTAIGKWNVGGGDPLLEIPTDPIFEIGIGFSSVRINALTVLKNGTITAPSFSIGEIENAGDKALVTKEYVESNYLIVGANANVGKSLQISNTDTGNDWSFLTTNYLNLYRNGTFKGSWNATSGAYVQASDRRVKKDITSLENGTLNKVMQLNPVSYLMKDQTDTKRNLGLISQEVQEIFPSITNYVEEADLITLSYTELIPILIKALQEQQGIIEAQKAKDIVQDKSISEQSQTIKSLVARLDHIEANSSN